MTMRPFFLLVASLAATSLSVASVAATPQPAATAAPPAAAPPFDADALIARDDLFEEGSGWAPYIPTLEGVIEVELDGAAPRERLILTVHPVPEAAAELHVHPYRTDGHAWVPLPRLRAGGYMETGYVLPIDLEGDGQQELMLVGDTDGVVPADLSVVRWDGAAFAELVWGVDPAPAYAVGDVDGDGTAEVVGLPGAYGGGVAVLGLADDGYLRPRATSPPGRWLPALLDAVVAAWPPRQHVLEGFGLAMEQADATPSGRATRVLIDRWPLLTRWEQADLPPLLARHADGRAFLADVLASPGPDLPREAIARALASTDDSRAHQAVLAELESAGLQGRHDDARAIAEGAVHGFAERGDPALIHVLRRWIDAPERDADFAADLVFWVLPLDRHGAEMLRDLVRGDDPALASAAAKGISRCAGPFAPEPGLFREVLDADLGRELLGSEVPELRSAGLDLLSSHDALPAGDARPALDGVQNHAWFARSELPEVWLEGLAAVQSDDDLQPYASRMLGRGPLGAEWHGIRDRAIAWSRDERGRMRQRASEVLGAFPDPEARAALVALLDDEINWVVTTAARQLARHQSPEAAEALLTKLRALTETEPPPPFAIGEVMRALAETREPTAIAALEARSRWDEAARFALQHGGVPGGEALARVLDHALASAGQDCKVLTQTATGLARVAPTLAEPRVVSVRRRCGDAWLVHLVDSYERAKALEPLTPLLEHPDRAVRVAAMQARGRLLRDYAIPR